MNVYFFGGTFDPPHKAHKLIYKQCMKLCDKFIFIPTGQSPEKSKPSATSEDRVKMLKLLIDKEDYGKVVIDQFEIESIKKPNYSIDTIQYLKKKFNPSSIYMVIGMDQYVGLPSWKHYDDLIKEVNIICFRRNLITNPITDEIESDIWKKGLNLSIKYNNQITFIDFNFDNIDDELNYPTTDISSTDIKKHIIENQFDNIGSFLTTEVCDFIIANKLYRNRNAN